MVLTTQAGANMARNMADLSHSTIHTVSSVMKIMFILLTTTAIANVHSQGQLPVFLVHPTSIAAVDGNTVEFTCTANNTDTLTYRVNGTSASLGSVTSKGFNQLDAEELDTLVIRRNLSVTVSSLYNNTEILCRAIGIDVEIEDSNAATLTIQGPLSSIDDLFYYFIDCSTINISWSPPFTLPGTHVTGYDISIGGTTTTSFTSNSYYVLLLTDITDSPYNDFTKISQVTVSGYNGLDGSKSNSVSILLPPVTELITEDISKDRELSLLVNFAQEFCVDNIVNNVTVTLLKGEMFDKFTSVLASNTINLTNAFEVVEDQNYTLNVSFSLFEEKNVIQNFTHFDTYGVQSLDVTDTSEDTVYIVCLFNTFSADSGCTVVLVSTTDQQQQYEGTFNKMDDNTASGNITGVGTGVYNIRAFDQGSNVVAVELLSVSITGEPLSTEHSNSLTSTIVSTSNDNNASTVTTLTSVSIEPSFFSPGSVASNWTAAVYLCIMMIFVIILLLVMVTVTLLIYKNKAAATSGKKPGASSDEIYEAPALTKM